VFALAPEHGIARAVREEILERFTQLDDRHLWRALRHFQHPGKLVALDGVQLAPQGELRRRWLRRVGSVRRVLALPFGQRPVVGEARHAGSARQVRGLDLVKVEGDLVRG
jgi:hypothetical protein